MSENDLAAVFNAHRSPPPVPGAPARPPSQQKPVDTTPLGREQSVVFAQMEDTNESAFITGRAGTGKSYLLNFFVANSRKSVVVVAPTGVAAINVGGQTIHSFFRIPPTDPIDKSSLVPSSSRRELYKNLDVVVVDEVSMVRSDVIDAMDHVLQEANGNSLPFGGKQMLMFGDLYQLPPVANPQVARYLDDTFGGAFFFHAPAIERLRMKRYELTHVFRQKDPEFIGILNEVRDGTITDASLIRLSERAAPASRDPAIIIAPTKDVVEQMNESMLNSIDEPLYTYEATVNGEMRETDFPTQRVLKLKVGARVMMLRNDSGTASDRPDENRRWVNGTLCQVLKLTDDQVWVMINGVPHQLDREVWNKFQYSYDPGLKKLAKRKTAEFTQFPITLAWAITVHKAQGATYQSVGLHLAGGMFAAGQTYVALSRCVDMNKLYLSRPIVREDIKVSNEVRVFMGGTSRSQAAPPSGDDVDDGIPF
jgi:hypothetical protein